MNEHSDLVMNHHYPGSPACVFSPTGPHNTFLTATSFRRGAPKIALIDNRPGNEDKYPEETPVITVPPKKQPMVFCLSLGEKGRTLPSSPQFENIVLFTHNHSLIY